MRVAGYVLNDNLIPKDKIDKCVALAIMHDLLEDTEFDYKQDFNYVFYDIEHFKECLVLLTRDKKLEIYKDYLRKIKDNYNSYPEAYWVKLSDIKDHLEKTDTLTDELKTKYCDTLSVLL